jgi:polyisoprenoid-binding protein YceI
MVTHAVEQPRDEAAGARTECWEVAGGGVISTLTFSLRHIVVSEIHGSFRRWGGALALDRQELSRSRLNAWVDLRSIDTGSPERDDHIRSAEFFDVTRFPLAELHSETIAALDASRFIVRGRLTLHGTSQVVELIVTPGPTSREGGVMRASFAARAVLDRQRFGLHWNPDLDVGGLVVGDRVDLAARIEATRVSAGPRTA